MAKLNSAKVAGGGVEIRSALVNGGAVGADLAIAGLRADAQLIAVVGWEAGVPVNRLASCRVLPGGGGIDSTADTTGEALLVLYTQRA